ncbi:hypothetical protein [Neomoorella thermoacetica]|uniref:hypothetical protein n=1 Tax=Neomoorella thermoacetica TaxID=1525 RepID=UPI0030D5B482
MYLIGNLMYAIYAAFLSFYNLLKSRDDALPFVPGLPLRQVFWYGSVSGMYAAWSVIFKELAAYSYGPALLFFQSLPLACGFFGAHYACKSLFGAKVPGERNSLVFLSRCGVSLLGGVTGIIFVGICGKILGV